MRKRHLLTQMTCAAAVTVMVACHSDGSSQAADAPAPATPAAAQQQAAPVARDVVETTATTSAAVTRTAAVTTAAAPAAPAPAPATPAASPFDKPGFVTIIDEKDGRIWVLREGEKPSNRMVVVPGAGPAGKTLKSLERETIIAYLAAKPGFVTMLDDKDGRLWVLREGEKPSNRMVVIPGVGPMNTTLKSLERETIIEYLAAKPGFVTTIDEKDGRLWVLREGEKPSNRMVVIPGVGPMNTTLKSLERETIIEYLAAKPGFVTFLDEKDGRLWVLLEGEKPSNRMVLVPGRGPMGTTMKSLESSTIEAYLATR